MSGLATKVAARIVDVMVQTIGELKSASYKMPTSKNSLVQSFNFRLDHGTLCSELTESLAENSIIKEWIQRVKEEHDKQDLRIASASVASKIVVAKANSNSLRLNFADWNEQLDKVANKVKEQVETKLAAIAPKTDPKLMNFGVTYAGESRGSGWSSVSSIESTSLKISFWAESVAAKPTQASQKSEAPSKGFLSSLFCS